MNRALLIVSLVVALAGCQNRQALMQSGRLTDTEFMNLWGVYRECRTSPDLDTMRADVRQLKHGAEQMAPPSNPALPLPAPIKRLVSKPPVRLSVDPRAMAADCTLSTGYVALDADRDDIAMEMFASILHTCSQSEYPYFVDQARLGLREVSLRAQAAARKQAPTLSQAVRVWEAQPAAPVVSY